MYVPGPKYGVRHDQHREQESKYGDGQQESLNLPEWCRCEEHGEAMFQGPHPSQ